MNRRPERTFDVQETRSTRPWAPFGVPEAVFAFLVFLTGLLVSDDSLSLASVLSPLAGVLVVAGASKWPLTTALISVPFAMASSYVTGNMGNYSIFFTVLMIEVVTAGGMAGVGLMLVLVHACASTVDFSTRTVDTEPTVIVVIVILLGAGYLIGRNRLSHAVQDANLRESLARSQRTQRLSLARELHDSVATSLTSVVMRSEALRLSTSQEQDPLLRDGLEDISHASRTALEQLRTMLRLLNSEDEDAATDNSHSPAPTIRSSLEATAKELRAHRLKVRTSSSLGRSAEPVVDRKALARILTEMTSNAVKHSPERAEIRLVCHHDAVSVTVTMVNPVRCSSATRDPVFTSNLGLGSMAARAQAAGGTLDAGAVPQRDSTVPLSSGGPVDQLWQTAVTLPIVRDVVDDEA